jgi:mannan endo-1,4-beta-mannosidase
MMTKKITSLLILIFACFYFFVAKSNAQAITLEAENAILSGEVTKSTYNSVNCAYMAGSGSIKFSVNIVSAGTYKLTLRAATPMGSKTQDLYVNNVHNGQVIFNANNNWFDQNAGAVSLKVGDNAIEIRKNWGWMYFDKITLEPTPKNNYSTTDEALVNANSDEKTKNVYAYLRSQYGKNIISGQTAYWNELIAVAGKTPVVRAFDFQTYTVGYPYLWDNSIGGHTFGWLDNGTTKTAIDWHKSTNGKGIVSFQWHWHSPSGGKVSTNTFYTDKTTFDVSKAVTPATAEYKAIVRDIDSIASQLKRLQNAGVPVLWRPLHEAGGKWFWWGAKTANDCLAIYDILYDRLTNYHKLNNLIWVWSTPEAEWYPGNGKVDIIGFDSYPGNYVYSSQKAIFNQLYDIVQGKKMIAMTENGPIPDIDKCIEEDAMWLYFSSWSDLVTKQNSNEHIKQVFAHGNVITLDEVFPTAIVDRELNSLGFSIYPNPATDVLQVYFEGVFESGGTISIINLDGKIVQEQQVAGNMTIFLNISQLNQGAYICRFNNGKESFISKFIKQ